MISSSKEEVVAKDDEIGFVAKDSSSALSHKVFPICDSLLSYLIDFGQLKPEDEAKYISQMIKDFVVKRKE